MGRRLFTLETAVSLVLFVPVVVLWVRGYWRVERLFAAPGQGVFLLGDSYSGWFELRVGKGWPAGHPAWVAESYAEPAVPVEARPILYAEGRYPPIRGRLPGFWYRTGVFHTRFHRDGSITRLGERGDLLPSPPLPFIAFGVRAWPLAALLVILPAWWVVRRILRRPGLGHCRCGYDLTANVSGVCPECGTPVVSKPSATPGTSPSTPPSASQSSRP